MDDVPLAQAQSMLFTNANRVLISAGWTDRPMPSHGSGYQVWTKTPSGSATIWLASSQVERLPVGEWSIHGDLPPVGQAVQGC